VESKLRRATVHERGDMKKTYALTIRLTADLDEMGVTEYEADLIVDRVAKILTHGGPVDVKSASLEEDWRED
jgi:hypothetical protein